MVDDVPCEQCEFCGEQYFEASVVKNIEREFEAIHSKGKNIVTIQPPELTALP